MRKLPVSIQREMPEEVEDDDGGDVKEKGRIDLVFLYGCRENVYFALECKRLNVSYNGKKRSLATDYVGEDGLFAFVKEWYSAGLDQAGMIGYVMDGDIDDAQRKVNKIIQKNKDKLKTDNGFKTSSIFQARKQIKETSHLLSTHCLLVHHIFLSVKKPQRHLIQNIHQ